MAERHREQERRDGSVGRRKAKPLGPVGRGVAHRFDDVTAARGTLDSRSTRAWTCDVVIRTVTADRHQRHVHGGLGVDDRCLHSCRRRSTRRASTGVDLLDKNLANPINVGKLDGSLVAKPAVFQVGANAVIPYASAGGLSIATFDGGWQQTNDVLVGGTNEPITGLAVTLHGDAARRVHHGRQLLHRRAAGRQAGQHLAGRVLVCLAPDRVELPRWHGEGRVRR